MKTVKGTYRCTTRNMQNIPRVSDGHKPLVTPAPGQRLAASDMEFLKKHFIVIPIK